MFVLFTILPLNFICIISKNYSKGNISKNICSQILSNFTFYFFFPLNKLEILFLFTFHLTICRTESQKEQKNKVQTAGLLTFLNLLLVFFQCSSLLPIHWYWKESGISSCFSKLNSLTIDMQQEYQNLIYKTFTQVEGYNLLFTTLSHYIDSAVT